MVSGNQTLFAESELDQLHDAVLCVMSNTGLKICDDRFLNGVASIGARVDWDARVARFPPSLVEAFIDRRKTTESARASHRDTQAGPYEASLSSVIAPFVHDYPTKTRRWSTRADLVEITRWAEIDTPQSRSVGLAVTMSDVDPHVEPIEAYALLLEMTSRPSPAYATDSDQVKYLIDIAAVYYGEPRFPRGIDFMTSPLTFGDRLARFTREAIEFGETHFGIGVMPICGGNAPMTIAGNVVVSAAELLGAWLTIQSLQPEATFSGSACNGMTDMRRGVATFNAPEALLADLGVCELFERRYGGRVGVAAGADYIDARLPGMQAAYERTMRAMAIAAFTGGPYAMGGAGTLDEGKVFSAVQFILEREMGAGLWRLGQGIEVTPETLAVDTIAEVGVGEGKSYLTSDHTLRHYRETWFPEYLVRGMWESDAVEFAREAQMMERAYQHYRDCVARYAAPQIDESKLRQIRRIVARAREDLLRR
ncbi:MAG: hypothetical protein GX620_10660 [Chloroflexi bacterium]|nr:hypothetical protein [Chloroflexota bacterium]